MSRKKILFIINPISGIGKQKVVERNIELFLSKQLFEYEISYTKFAKHATEISRSAASHFDIVTAVGGDGSVNEVSAGLINTKTALAIIPAGSGNGFARHLKIPLNPKDAIEVINSLNIKEIDTLQIQDKSFVNVAGVGFDAEIAHRFATFGKRGFIPYLQLIINQAFKYQPQEFEIEIDGKIFREKVFLITIANSSQYGFNACISPNSNLSDGIIELCIIQPFPLIYSPILGMRLFNKSIPDSSYVKIFQGKNIRIKYEKEIFAHIDGEPVKFENEIKIKILPLSLRVVAK